jgi:hypothetical protein
MFEVEAVPHSYIPLDQIDLRITLYMVFLADNTEVPSSIPGATRFSEYHCVWNGIHSALVRINEELLERKLAAPV